MLGRSMPPRPHLIVPRTGKRDRTPAVTDDHVIRILFTDNPGKYGPNRRRYALLRDGMTVAEFYKAAAPLGYDRTYLRSNITWLIKYGHVRLEAPTVPAFQLC
jgi:hypothetical protein